jgi:ubiquinone/menaquinone biosynthesis C-methylase UbiE
MQTSPNSEAIAVWNDILVPKFTRFRHILVEGFGAHATAAFLRHVPVPGGLVLDVGCGFGESTIELARRVGPNGYVLGVDCCDAFLSVARQDAIRAGVTNLRFETGDAQVHRFRTGFDLAFSRFGTLFFQSPLAALLNLRRGLKPGGRLLMLVWRRLEDNEWQALPRRLARTHLALPDEAPSGPGPFSMADQAGLTPASSEWIAR